MVHVILFDYIINYYCMRFSRGVFRVPVVGYIVNHYHINIFFNSNNYHKNKTRWLVNTDSHSFLDNYKDKADFKSTVCDRRAWYKSRRWRYWKIGQASSETYHYTRPKEEPYLKYGIKTGKFYWKKQICGPFYVYVVLSLKQVHSLP